MGRAIPDGERAAYLQDLITLLELERYHDATEEREVVLGIRNLVSELRALSDKFPNLNSRELEALADAEMRAQGLAHLLSGAHRTKMDERLRENTLKMQLIVGLYAGFALLGVVLVMGASFLFHRTLAQPLQSLAQAASEIAEGNLHKKVPVASRDEIGQLSHAFNLMTDRLKTHEESLKGLATLEERERIAQELHDSLTQDLALLRLKVIDMEQTLLPSDRQAVAETLTEMRKIVDNAYEDVRQAIFGLRTMVSKGLGFIPTLTEYLHDFSELRKIPVDFKIDGAHAFRFRPQVEIQLIRIIHEAVTNVFKHARATRTEVKFEREGEFAKVSIEDNGQGFRPQEVKRNGLHFGLQTMRERAEGVGGSLVVETVPGRGTKVTVRLPQDHSSYETYSSAPGR
ncbi:MAG: HAMP domain-containing protein [Deltaproteobacteria bacterium]|nr:HAMP domain-containing protein [Deltaproteobacteria bacterium]